MVEELLLMSQKEVSRLDVMQRLQEKRLSQVEAAQLLNLSTRQVRSLQRRYGQQGAASLVSKRRGKQGNHRLKESLKLHALALIQTHYADFGPTLAHEKLTEKHGLKLSVESVRQLMISAGLWKGKRRRQGHVHQTRPRRNHRGELVQLDGSPHDWFEDRGPRCCLIVLIDDATSELMQLHFVEQECAQGYFDAIHAHITREGRPQAYYSDKHSIFRVNIKEAAGGTGDTQLGRALKQLDIELICAHSPQAKGRVERANQTLQDRLVKELRLNHICDIVSANAFLPQFMADYNRRFAHVAANAVDAHRVCVLSPDELRRILSYQHTRKITKNLELSYNNVIYQIVAKQPNRMRGAIVTVCDNANQVSLVYKGHILEYQTRDKQNRPAPIKDSKQIAVQPLGHKPSESHPWRRAWKSDKRARQPD